MNNTNMLHAFYFLFLRHIHLKILKIFSFFGRIRHFVNAVKGFLILENFSKCQVFKSFKVYSFVGVREFS